jgi:ribosome-associated protein
MTETPSSASRYLQKLQRTIAEALDDVKAQDVKIFNTAAMTPLFERVVIASGTSSRQTRALAAHVRDQVVAMGGDKPRVEGQDAGEWIVVDCGAAVVHIMHPAVRQYYRLEDIWGEKPVRLKRSGTVDK